MAVGGWGRRPGTRASTEKNFPTEGLDREKLLEGLGTGELLGDWHFQSDGGLPSALLLAVLQKIKHALGQSFGEFYIICHPPAANGL